MDSNSLSSDFVSGQQINDDSSDFNQLVELEKRQTSYRRGRGLHHVRGPDPCSGELDALPSVRRNDLRFRGDEGGACQKQDSRGAEDTVELRR